MKMKRMLAGKLWHCKPDFVFCPTCDKAFKWLHLCQLPTSIVSHWYSRNWAVRDWYDRGYFPDGVTRIPLGTLHDQYLTFNED